MGHGRWVGVLGGAVLVAGCAAACASAPSPGTTSPPQPDVSSRGGMVVVRGGGDLAFPGDTLTDWVGYGDSAVVVDVVSEQADRPTTEEERTGEGLIGRHVAATVVSTVWQRRPDLTAPATLELAEWGWFLHDGKRRPAVTRGCSRVEPGHRYFMVLSGSYDVNSSDDSGGSGGSAGSGWGEIGSCSVVPDDDRTLGYGERGGQVPGDRDAGLSEANLAVRGRSLDEVGALLRTTAPDPLAVKYGDLPVARRWQAVLTERYGTTSPSRR